MIIINNEVYISLELIKLLKQVGFNLECRLVQVKIGEFEHLPTLAVVQKWLREVKEIEIDILCVYINNAKKYSYCIFKGKYNNERIEEGFDTYEEAQEAGIKKVLELILNKIK